MGCGTPPTTSVDDSIRGDGRTVGKYIALHSRSSLKPSCFRHTVAAISIIKIVPRTISRLTERKKSVLFSTLALTSSKTSRASSSVKYVTGLKRRFNASEPPDILGIRKASATRAGLEPKALHIESRP